MCMTLIRFAFRAVKTLGDMKGGNDQGKRMESNLGI